MRTIPTSVWWIPIAGRLTHSVRLNNSLDLAEAVAEHLAKVPDTQRREQQRLSIEMGLDAPMVVEAARYFHKLMREMDGRAR